MLTGPHNTHDRLMLKRIVDFKESNLHVMSYSMPVRKRLPLAALKEHLFTVPEHPDWIPYRTS